MKFLVPPHKVVRSTARSVSIMLVGTGNGTFAWSGPNGFTSTAQNPTVGIAGTYNLTVTGANGCTSDSIC